MKFRKLLLVATMMAVSSVSVFASTPTESASKHSRCSHSLEVETKTEESITCQEIAKEGERSNCPIPGNVNHKYNQMRYQGIQRDTTFHGGITGNCTITSSYDVYTKECSCGANDGRTYRTFIGESHSGC